jgi:hypothetical protein
MDGLDYEVLGPVPYPRGVIRRGNQSLAVQPIVKPWLEDVKETIARIQMTTPNRVSSSQAIEVLLRAWQKLSDEEKVQLVKHPELITKRMWGRPRRNL